MPPPAPLLHSQECRRLFGAYDNSYVTDFRQTLIWPLRSVGFWREGFDAVKLVFKQCWIPGGGGGGGGALNIIGYTGMCHPTASNVSSPNSITGYPFWPWTLGLGITFDKRFWKCIVIDDTAKGGLTLFWELSPWFLAVPKISNVNNIDIWRPLGLKLK